MPLPPGMPWPYDDEDLYGVREDKTTGTYNGPTDQAADDRARMERIDREREDER